MSTWGGIGEGLTAGMNARIALEERRRREDLAQSNWQKHFDLRRKELDRRQQETDQEFQFKREQAERAQANADRTFAEGVRRADMAQANADREYALKQDEAALKSDIASAELSLKQDEMDMKRESQDWSNMINAERLNQFQMQNDELAQSWQKKQEEEQMVQATGRNQLAHGIYMMKHGSDSFPTAKVEIDGKEMEARIMPDEMRTKLVGTEGPLKDVSSFLLVNTDNGWVPAIQKQTQNGPTVIPFDEAQQYDIFESVNKGFGDREMREYKEKRDLGLKIAEAEGKALASDREGIRSLNSLFQTGIKEGIFTDEESREIADYALGVIRKRKGMATSGGGGSSEWGGMDPRFIEQWKKRGYTWDEKTQRPVKGSAYKPGKVYVPTK